MSPVDRMRHKVLTLAIGAALLGSTATAGAQESDLAVEGPGYPLGEGTVVHPILGAEVGFTDNVFYADAGRNPSGILRLIAEAAIASKKIQPDEGSGAIEGLAFDEDGSAGEPADPAVQKLEFRAGGRLAFSEWLSPENTVRSQRDLAADLSGSFTVNPQGAVAFDASDHFRRDTRPTNFESFGGTNRDSNQLALGLRYQPGGRTLSIGARWENAIDWFEDPDQRFANRMINTIRARSEWEFFPYSKAFADISYGFIGPFAADGGAIAPAKRAANPIRGGLGIATSITEIFTVKASLGWAYAAYEGGAAYNTPVVGAEVGYRYSPVGRIVVEYAWNHQDSVNADFYGEHMIGARLDQQIGPRIVATATGEVRWRTYEGVPMDVGPPTRSDLLFALGARAQYVLRDYLAIVADYRTEVDQTDYRTTFQDVDDPSFVRTEVTVGVRAAF